MLFMKILFIGDIVAKPGRQLVQKLLPGIRKKERIDFALANAENLAHGRGVTKETLDEMLGSGVDYFTSGNHVFHQENFAEILNDESFRILRPANYPSDLPGRGFTKLDLNGINLLLVNLSGNTLIKGPLSDPFRKADEILDQFLTEKQLVTIIDFHAELTSEKRAFGFYLDGRVSAVLGTHTHVGTIDSQILPQNTAYITDVGMTGSYDSVLGVEKEIIIENQMNPFPQRFEWEKEGRKIFNSVVLDFDKNGRAKKIKRLDILE